MAQATCPTVYGIAPYHENTTFSAKVVRGTPETTRGFCTGINYGSRRCIASFGFFYSGFSLGSGLQLTMKQSYLFIREIHQY